MEYYSAYKIYSSEEEAQKHHLEEAKVTVLVYTPGRTGDCEPRIGDVVTIGAEGQFAELIAITAEGRLEFEDCAISDEYIEFLGKVAQSPAFLRRHLRVIK